MASKPIELYVFRAAQQLVVKPPTMYGYGDIGDVLVAYLRGEKTALETIDTMALHDQDYERARRPAPVRFAPSSAPRWRDCPGAGNHPPRTGVERAEQPSCTKCGRTRLAQCDGNGRVQITNPNAKGYCLTEGCPND